MSRIPVLVITSSYPRARDDYAGIFIQDLLMSLVCYGYAFRVIAPRASEGPVPPDGPCCEGEVRVQRFGFFVKRSWEKLCYADGMLNNLHKSRLAGIQVPFYLVAALYSGSRAVKGCRIIWSHWALPSGLIGALLGKFTGKKHILSLHSGWTFLLKYGWLGSAVARFIIAHADRITAVSASIREETIRLCRPADREGVGKKIILLPMGVSLARFAHPDGIEKELLREKYNITSGRTVLSVGRLIPLKGIEYLIQAVRDKADVTLLIAGSGSEEERLRSLSEGAKCDVRFLGVVSGERKTELFRLADVVVVPSVGSSSGQTEGLPVAILEAMASGTPVIATGIGGIVEIIQNSYNGLLVRQADPDDLRDKIDSLLEGRGDYAAICRNSREASQRFGLESLSERYRSVFEFGCHGTS